MEVRVAMRRVARRRAVIARAMRSPQHDPRSLPDVPTTGDPTLPGVYRAAHVPQAPGVQRTAHEMLVRVLSACESTEGAGAELLCAVYCVL